MKNDNISLITILTIVIAVASIAISVRTVVTLNRIETHGMTQYHGMYCYVNETKIRLFNTEIIYGQEEQKFCIDENDTLYYAEIGELKSMIVNGRHKLEPGWYWLSLKHIGDKTVLTKFYKDPYEDMENVPVF